MKKHLKTISLLLLLAFCAVPLMACSSNNDNFNSRLEYKIDSIIDETDKEYTVTYYSNFHEFQTKYYENYDKRILKTQKYKNNTTISTYLHETLQNGLIDTDKFICGWYLDPQHTKEWDFMKDTVHCDIALYPKIVYKKIKVSFYAQLFKNGNLYEIDFLDTKTYNYNEILYTSDIDFNSPRPYYIFMGLYNENVPIIPNDTHITTNSNKMTINALYIYSGQ